jgi:hypothetical protein
MCVRQHSSSVLPTFPVPSHLQALLPAFRTRDSLALHLTRDYSTCGAALLSLSLSFLPVSTLPLVFRAFTLLTQRDTSAAGLVVHSAPLPSSLAPSVVNKAPSADGCRFGSCKTVGLPTEVGDAAAAVVAGRAVERGCRFGSCKEPMKPAIAADVVTGRAVERGCRFGSCKEPTKPDVAGRAVERGCRFGSCKEPTKPAASVVSERAVERGCRFGSCKTPTKPAAAVDAVAGRAVERGCRFGSCKQPMQPTDTFASVAAQNPAT